MKSFCESEFWEQYEKLPSKIQDLADSKFALWTNDPNHASLEFKKVKGKPDWWSVRIGLTYRALCIRIDDKCNWFFIGSHADCDSLMP